MAAPTIAPIESAATSNLNLCGHHFGKLKRPSFDNHWRIDTLFCYDCGIAFQYYLKDKSIAELSKISFMKPELRLLIREHIFKRKGLIE